LRGVLADPDPVRTLFLQDLHPVMVILNRIHDGLNFFLCVPLSERVFVISDIRAGEVPSKKGGVSSRCAEMARKRSVARRPVGGGEGRRKNELRIST
jgi:hypothetical protein